MYSQTPQYRLSWDWRNSGGIPKTAVLGVIYYNLQNPYLGLENGRRYWECGGIGSGGIEGADCTRVFFKRAFGIVSTGCVLFHVSLAPYVVNILWLHVPLHTRLSVAFQDSSIPEQHYWAILPYWFYSQPSQSFWIEICSLPNITHVCFTGSFFRTSAPPPPSSLCYIPERYKLVLPILITHEAPPYCSPMLQFQAHFGCIYSLFIETIRWS